MRQLGLLITSLIIVPLAASSVRGAMIPVSLYYVGNSLTVDLEAGRPQIAAATRGYDWAFGDHIRASKGLPYIWGNPTEVAWLSSYGTFASALPNYKWDVVTLEPYPDSTTSFVGTLSADAQVIKDMMALTRSNPQNANTRFYIYAPWHPVDMDSSAPDQYATSWLEPTTGAASELTQLSRGYFSDLYATLVQTEPKLHVIPAGETLYEVERRIRSGDIPHLTDIRDLYRDLNHMNDLGRYTAAWTAFATICGESPVGLPFDSSTMVVPSDTLEAIQSTVWDVVTSQPATGVPEPAAGCLVILCSIAAALHRPRRCDHRAGV